MTSENIGAQEDLALSDTDADKVVGGKMWRRKHKTKKKQAAHPVAASPCVPLKHSAGGAGDDSLESYMAGSPEMGG